MLKKSLAVIGILLLSACANMDAYNSSCKKCPNTCQCHNDKDGNRVCGCQKFPMK